MAINYGGVKYLLGPSERRVVTRSDEHIGSVFVAEHNSTCPVYKDWRGKLWLSYVPLNSQWPHGRAMRTQSELLAGWS